MVNESFFSFASLKDLLANLSLTNVAFF